MKIFACRIFLLFRYCSIHSDGARSQNWGGAFEGQQIFFGGQNLPPRCQNFDPLDFFADIPKLIFSQTFKIVPADQNFFQDLLIRNFSTFQKFSQFCLSNSDFPTTFGRFSYKSLPCRCGSYSYSSERLMISTKIIKNSGGQKWGQKTILGDICPPPPP